MAEPISVPEAKKHLRVDSAADDTLIADKIQAAREWVEDYTGLILTRRQVTETLTGGFRAARLRAWPIAADEPLMITYRDRAGAEYTIADATVRAKARPALIYPAAGSYWPGSYAARSVEVTLTAGYPTAAAIPAKLKQAMLVMLTAFYEDREGGALFAAAERSARGLCRAERGQML
jgi:uncharacterized phiE125 gp8 family phage protein